MKPTEKQAARVKRIIEGLGETFVADYISGFYPGAKLDALTKDQAQKIITGLGHRIAKPISGVVPWPYL